MLFTKSDFSTKLILIAVFVSFSQLSWALECKVSSNETLSGPTISIDENTETVKLIRSSGEIDDLGKFKKSSTRAEKYVYQFTKNHSRGTTHFKLFYLEIMDEWRLLQALLNKADPAPLLLAVVNQVYTCKS